MGLGIHICVRQDPTNINNCLQLITVGNAKLLVTKLQKQVTKYFKVHCDKLKVIF